MDLDMNVTRMTLQNILEARNLTQPFPALPAGKDEKESIELFPDATAAFLGPNLWEDFKTNGIDLVSFLNNHSEYGQPELENIGDKVKIISHLRPLNPMDSPMNDIDCIHAPHEHQVPQQDMTTTGIESSQHHMNVSNSDHISSKSPHNGSLQDFNVDMEDNRRLYPIDCKFSPSDLALATPPGHKHYDPTSATFPDEELKPQPMIKKSRKNFVPDSLKDDRYWARRHKNNIAAKRSREARRLKENQIVLRASYLEKENNTLKEDVLRLQAENNLLKSRLKEYES